ncbi:hypothetical protein B0H13DRAFT_1851039 [Mycena leptocephala]|nr:hypothetical protein B0H13DRAFT_1851039 [Mycena leptocephala]
MYQNVSTPQVPKSSEVPRDNTPDGAFRESPAKQLRSVEREFEDHISKIVVAFAEEALNTVWYYDNKNFARNVSIVPREELECTVLEVKVIEGLGTTIDVVVLNGILREGGKIVVCGLNGPIVPRFELH